MYLTLLVKNNLHSCVYEQWVISLRLAVCKHKMSAETQGWKTKGWTETGDIDAETEKNKQEIEEDRMGKARVRKRTDVG